MNGGRGISEDHVLMICKAELTRQMEDLKPEIVEEAAFAAASGTRDALNVQAIENLENIARVIKVEEKDQMMKQIEELTSEAAHLRTNFNALQKLYDTIPRPRKEDDPFWEPYSNLQADLFSDAPSEHQFRKTE